MVSIRVRLAEAEAVVVPELMSIRSLVLRVMMGKEVRRLPDHFGGGEGGVSLGLDWIGRECG